MMDRETYNKLKKFEDIFKHAIKMDFLRIGWETFDEIADIYEQYFNVKMNKSQRNCNSCRLKAVKQLGKAYFEVALAYEKEAEQEAKKAAEKEVEKEQTKPKRRKKALPKTEEVSIETEQ